MIKGGSILLLQRILRHSTLNVTMRYAHLAPGHLQEVIELNPVTRRHIVDNSGVTED